MKYLYEQVKEDFDKKEYILLTPEDDYKNVNQKLNYICPIHGEKQITYAHLREGKGCPECGREKSRQAVIKPDSYYKKIAESKGFEFMGTSVVDGVKYADVICPKHKEQGIQHVQTQNLRRNKGCKFCAGNMKLTEKDAHENFVNKIYKIYGDSLTINEKYVNQKTKISCTCNIHMETNSVFPSNLIKGHNGCSQCGREKLSKASFKTHEEFKNEVETANPHIKLIDKYKGANGSLKCFCKIHNKTFSKYFSSLINGHTGCDECYKEDMRNRMGKSSEQFKEELAKIHPELKVIGEYTNRSTPLKFYCTTHNIEFESKPCDILKRESCCPKSMKFVKEKSIGNLLEEWNIKYETQKRFDDCKDKRTLPFDFYLVDFNILLEYQGQQHYTPVKFGTQNKEEAISKYKYTIKHDKIKKKYCNDHNISLIEIPYWEYDDLEFYLFDQLVKHNVIQEIKCA